MTSFFYLLVSMCYTDQAKSQVRKLKSRVVKKQNVSVATKVKHFFALSKQKIQKGGVDVNHFHISLLQKRKKYLTLPVRTIPYIPCYITPSEKNDGGQHQYSQHPKRNIVRRCCRRISFLLFHIPFCIRSLIHTSSALEYLHTP